MRKDFVEADVAMPSSQCYDHSIDNSLRSLPSQPQRKTQLGACMRNRDIPSFAPLGSEKDIHMIIESIIS